MGYTTTFTGELKFTTELTSRALAKIKTFFGEDCRDHKEWDCDGAYIDLRFNDDFSGIEWDDETEKNRGMLDHINLIISEMKKEFPDFGLEGTMIAQGEEATDRWTINIIDGKAVRSDIVVKGEKVRCPHCNETFFIETVG